MNRHRDVLAVGSVVTGVSPQQVMGLLPPRDWKPVELALVAEGTFLPRLDEDVENLREYALRGGIVVSLAKELDVGAPAGPAHDAAVESPVAGDVEYGKIFSQSQRMPVRKGDASRADAQPLGACRDVRAYEQRIRRAVVPTVYASEVMFREPEGGHADGVAERRLLAKLESHALPSTHVLHVAVVEVGSAVEAHGCRVNAKRAMVANPQERRSSEPLRVLMHLDQSRTRNMERTLECPRDTGH